VTKHNPDMAFDDALDDIAPKGGRRRKVNGPAQPETAKDLGLLLWDQIDADTATDRLIKGLIGEQSLAIIAGPTGSGT